MLHQNVHLVVNGCRWLACLEMFTQPCTNIWLLNMRTGGGVNSFLRLDFIFRVEAPFCVIFFLISFWECVKQTHLLSVVMSNSLQRRYDLESSLMCKLFSSMGHIQKMMNKFFYSYFYWHDFPFLSFFKPSFSLHISLVSLASNSP